MTRDELNGVKTLLPFLAIKHIYPQPFADVINALEAAWKERDDVIKERGFLSSQNSELIEDVAAITLERGELRETVKVLSERLADMAVERDRGSLSPASECIGTQEMAELKKDCLRALSCLYVSVEESIANDVKAKVVAYISALECALAEALTDKDEFEGRLNDIYSIITLGVASPRQTIALATHDDALRYSAELSIKKEGNELTASLVALHELRP